MSDATIVILDATEVSADWLLRSPSLRRAATDPSIEFAIPTSVLIEVRANQARAAQKSRMAVKKALRDHHLLGFPPQPFREHERDYEDQLDQALERIEATILPWPQVSHETIVNRAALRTPPFDERGSGYRDTLVWFAALELAQFGREVILASKDRDFSDKAGNLASNLLKDAESCSGSVTLVHDLKAWLALRLSSGVKDQVGAESSRSVMRDSAFFDDFLAPWSFEDVWLAPSEVGLPTTSEHAYLANIEHASDYRKTVERPLIDGGTFTKWESDVILTLETSIPADYAVHQGWTTTYSVESLEVALSMPAIVTFSVYYDSDDEGLDIDQIDFHRTGPAQLLSIEV